jgi:hypothetical protein
VSPAAGWGPRVGRVGVLDAHRRGFTDEEVIEIRPVPMRVRDGVVRAGGDQEFTVAVGASGGLPGGVVEEAEAAFQPAGDPGMRREPGAPSGEGADRGQIVAVGEGFEQQVRQGRGGFADGLPRMAALLDQDHPPAEPPQDHRGQRSGESRSDHGEVEI